ncbi:MAG: RebB protein [Alteromonadaceae bacterium]|nr:MAG: RebB protein [Alteromonadaceae bacterium]
MTTDSNQSVNAQVTDSVASTNTSTVALAPAMAMGSLYETLSNSISMATSNAVFAQQQSYINYQTATTMGVKSLIS